jgi:hypothetical protein
LNVQRIRRIVFQRRPKIRTVKFLFERLPVWTFTATVRMHFFLESKKDFFLSF